MTYDEFNAFCGSLPVTSYVMQRGGAHVWKVAGKVFAIGGWRDDFPAVTFKAGEIGYEVLKDQPGMRPAPYMASRGLKWIQHYTLPGPSDEEMQEHIRHSYALVVQGMSKKKRRDLGLLEGA